MKNLVLVFSGLIVASGNARAMGEATCFIREGVSIVGSHGESSMGRTEATISTLTFLDCAREAQSRLGRVRVGEFIFRRAKRDRYHRGLGIRDPRAEFRTVRVVARFHDPESGEQSVVRIKETQKNLINEGEI